jgi:hypothetical protein
MPLSAQQREHKRLTRAKNRPCHPLMVGRERGVWHPDLVGKVPNYPRTQEHFDKIKEGMARRIREMNAAGITKRDGIPNGWTRELAAKGRAKAAKKAKKIVDKMIEEKRFQPDCVEARIAMEMAVAIVEAGKQALKGVPLVPISEVNKAMKTVLEFTQKKPMAVSSVHIKSAEDFLDDIAGGE